MAAMKGCLLGSRTWWYLPDDDAVLPEVLSAIHVVRRVGSEPAIDVLDHDVVKGGPAAGGDGPHLAELLPASLGI